MGRRRGRARPDRPCPIHPAHQDNVRLPADLAAQALKSWERDDTDGDLPAESPEQRTTRHRAGTLALIGLAIQEDGRREGDEVTVELDAREIGNALETADDMNLLRDLTPPPR